MAFVTANRVKDYTTTSGTGNITLASTPPTGFNQFNGSIPTGSTCHYCVVDGANYEIGLGTFTEPATLARTTPLETKVSGVIDITTPAAITLSGSNAEVFITMPASELANHSTLLTPLASIPTTGTQIVVAMVPKDGRLISAYFGSSTGLVASDTNYITFTLVNKGQGGAGTTAMFATTCHTKATGGVTVTADAKWTMSISGIPANLIVAAGDRLILTATMTGTLPGALTYPTYQLNFGI